MSYRYGIAEYALTHNIIKANKRVSGITHVLTSQYCSHSERLTVTVAVTQR